MPAIGKKLPHVRLCGGFAQQGLKQIRFFDEALREWQIRGIDRLFCRAHGRNRKRCDSRCDFVDKRADLVGRENAIEVTPTLGGFRIEIIAGENHFDGAATADKPRQALRASAAGQNAERHFHLIDAGFAAHAIPQIHTHRQFTAAAAHAPFDLRDRHLGHGAKAFAHQVIFIQLRIAYGGTVSGKLNDRADIEMGEKKIRVRAAQDEHGDIVVCRHFLRQPSQLHIQLGRDDVDGRCIHRGNCDSTLFRDANKLVVVGHWRRSPG